MSRIIWKETRKILHLEDAGDYERVWEGDDRDGLSRETFVLDDREAP